MPRRCCVPGCKGNYSSTLKSDNYISVFLFPKDEELRKKWIAAIPRKHWTPTKYSAVCSLHFGEDDIQRCKRVVTSNGVHRNALVRCPKLVPDAVPSIFCKSDYFEKLALLHKNNYEKRRQLIVDFIDVDFIVNFVELITKYQEKLEMLECWHTKLTNSKIYFYKLDHDNDLLAINTQIVIDDQMKIYIFHEGKEISITNSKRVPLVNKKLCRWSQLQNLLTRYKSEFDVPANDEIDLIEKHVKKSLEELNKAYTIADSIELSNVTS
ncbi:uncharacterized protein LOC122396851 [Colletes gigas]|uniref:uncharacterized protein LOC122396851 n=1 Tax=Colletes gigas TaxID=935657 RepID=UPI001C9ADD87|nr:uncharacterized protein LOC122396851 [Colletes gigas]